MLLVEIKSLSTHSLKQDALIIMKKSHRATGGVLKKDAVVMQTERNRILGLVT